MPHTRAPGELGKPSCWQAAPWPRPGEIVGWTLLHTPGRASGATCALLTGPPALQMVGRGRWQGCRSTASAGELHFVRTTWSPREAVTLRTHGGGCSHGRLHLPASRVTRSQRGSGLQQPRGEGGSGVPWGLAGPGTGVGTPDIADTLAASLHGRQRGARVGGRLLCHRVPLATTS